MGRQRGHLDCPWRHACAAGGYIQPSEGVRPADSGMQPTSTATALIIVGLLLAAALAAPYKGERDGDGSFRKKPLRRGGCSSFGHSCFGGHGKRSEDYLAQARRFQRVSPPTDIIRQWLEAYHSSSSLLE